MAAPEPVESSRRPSRPSRSSRPSGEPAGISGWRPAPAVAPPLAEVSPRPSRSDRTTLLSAIGPVLSELARTGADPLACVAGPTLREREVITRKLRQVMHQPGVLAALGQLSRADATALIHGEVGRVWPACGAVEVEALTAALSTQLGEQLRDCSAFSVRDHVVGSLNAAARDTERLGHDALRLAELGRVVNVLSAGTPHERAVAARLASQLGVGEQMFEHGERARVALVARAEVLRQEARELTQSGVERITHALNHFGERERLLRRNGLQPGSWAAEALRESEKRGAPDSPTVDRLALGLAAIEFGALALFGPAGLEGTVATVSAELAGRDREPAQGPLELAHDVLFALGLAPGQLGSEAAMQLCLKGLASVLDEVEGAGLSTEQRSNVVSAARLIRASSEPFAAAFTRTLDAHRVPAAERLVVVLAFLAAQGDALGRLGAEAAAEALARLVDLNVRLA